MKYIIFITVAFFIIFGYFFYLIGIFDLFINICLGISYVYLAIDNIRLSIAK